MTGEAAPLRLADCTGIVLAGGRSARYGSDKLAAELDGRPLLHHAIEAILAVAPEVIVVASPDRHPAMPAGAGDRVRICHDSEAFGGPLAGVAVALDLVRTSTALVAGGDMPSLVPAVLHRLASAVSPSRPAVVLEVPGRVQPLPMALDVDAAHAAAAGVLGRGGRSLWEFLLELGAATLPAPVWLALDPAGATIVDIDRPADLRS
jgi:molybdopterin-guanine dinucleotide biosynthesis protein A